ncbi:hypothetical protein H6P81_005621 [Aristolochia fimbriata]|uniref:Methyltransferase type 11 domain-containing protein n=1 Tax=Aristolochia fimbriata TaxID=158543 RepID=A0AAV7EYU4_ARIFI|nr:hypothetical protein H6P81_005621 [Aristolochia fimbriata]
MRSIRDERPPSLFITEHRNSASPERKRFPFPFRDDFGEILQNLVGEHLKPRPPPFFCSFTDGRPRQTIKSIQLWRKASLHRSEVATHPAIEEEISVLNSVNPVPPNKEGRKKEIKMGKAGRSWMQIYRIYGMEEWQTVMFLLIHALVFSAVSFLILSHFSSVASVIHSLVPSLPQGGPRFAAGFLGALTALLSICLFLAAHNFLQSSLSLNWAMSQRMLASIPDWSSVKTALELGCCGRGILLNSVALQLKKQGSSGRVVGLGHRRGTALGTLRTARAEGVQEYVTCREGDARRLPFADNYFDAVVSGVYLHGVGKEEGRRKGGSSASAAASERMKVLGEVVRVLKPGGVGVLWDLVCVPEYVERLHELRMEEIRASEKVTAYMASSQIVSFRKPMEALPYQYQHTHYQQHTDWSRGGCSAAAIGISC